MNARQLADELLAWWDSHGRKDLPWQQDPTPYRVWVSEIMLQQTQVATVERYYPRFMHAFPDVKDLALAAQDDVLHLWSGLGYYSRARNLHRAARLVVAEHGGKLPENLDALMSLPGIGRSTAGAILALAHDQCQPILDGNVKRVLARVFGVEGWGGATANQKILWQHAVECTPSERVANYTQAIMDLGATVCTRGRAACERCPLQARCVAFATGRVAAIPAPKPRRARPRRSAVLVMARRSAHEVLLQKRPPTGIWGGLWSFPELDSTAAITDWCVAQLGRSPRALREWPVVDHSFSHFDFAMTPVEVEIEVADDCIMEGEQWLWYNTQSPGEVGLAAPVARLLSAMATE